MKSSINPTVHLSKKQVIVGKWHKQKYEIIQKLGEGSRGSIYLAKYNRGTVALKISAESSVVTAEVNVLKKLNNVQGVQLGPLLLDVDDMQLRPHESYSFYVMEYIDGVPVRQWLDSKGFGQIGIIGSQLLFQLYHLHLQGYVFGDLKLDNMLVERSTGKLRLLDMGGVTQKGRLVREYTSQYDRGYWGKGSRKAEESYDLFAFVVCMLHLDSSLTIEKRKNQDISYWVQQSRRLRIFHKVFENAVNGKYSNAKEMKVDFDNAIKNQASKSRKKSPSKKVDRPNHNELWTLSSIISVHVLILYYLVQNI
ncbi:serine/threonine protein kinase [Halalkalibacillus sediminis]|uniref:Serine/threonine protein kinase n=1 Tax=Halalkalibacillus sediminis TaxID=2018042 RepID=A0A2I0QT37_9BACI|nr:protein kinase [Halalkalibacillus sediminis]PKR77515.1 serine/threonine protein kinase [Halalkalibacillus sediminis]